jgi:hypothetical protein
MKSLAIALAVCFLITSCAQSAQPITTHVDANSFLPEHDETISANGTVADYYPNRASPHEVIFQKPNGAMLDASCMDTICHQMTLKISGSKKIPNGNYQFLQTDDAHIIVVRNGEGTSTLGYLAKNNGGGQMKFFPDLQEAQAFEHEGDAARTAGKVVVGALLVTALAALVVGAAAAQASANARANRVTTNCTSVGTNTTCTSY